EEKRHRKEMEKMKQHWDRVGFIVDGQYGIPTRCPCGGYIKHNVSPSPKFKHDFDTQPGSRYFTCTKFKDDGLHFCQPWVFAFSESNKRLRS
ncbi:unnamed protein product, partial [Thlaspi arvense]